MGFGSGLTACCGPGWDWSNPSVWAERVEALPEAADTEILLVGTSFSLDTGGGALALAMGRPVRTVVELGADGMGGLLAVRDELRAGTQARLVVWEIVERGLLEASWSAVSFR